jgi:hypothetical protein
MFLTVATSIHSGGAKKKNSWGDTKRRIKPK